ncbi:MAG: DUF5693 family protein [Armatimonadetes bacterium]|nr:DUF5693 family protein [Armatimonadota bacterium]
MNRRCVVLLLLFIGLAASLYVAGQRARVESGNKAVEIVLDYGEIQQIAASTGKSPVQVMRRFKAAGATSVAITEQTLKDVVDNGELIPVPRLGYSVIPKVGDEIVRRLMVALPDAGSRIRIMHTTAISHNNPNGPYAYIKLDGSLPISCIEQVPLGLPQEALEAVRQASLEPIARLINYPGVTPAAINAILKDVKSQGVNKIIFFGDQVLGFKGAVDDTAKALIDNGLYFGRVEFSKQKGELKLADKARSNVLVVHSITAEEMPKLDQSSIMERFQRGVRERGVRMCYVRMYDTASDDLIGKNADYVRSIARYIEKAGYQMKSAHPMGEVSVPKAMRILAGIGVAAGALLLILSIFDLFAGAFIAWAIVMLVICAGLVGAGETGRKLVALLSALVFPTLAIINSTRSTPESPSAVPGLVWKTLGRLAMAILTASVGGLLIVGLLSQRDFMLRINQFMGVKAAHLLPVVILAAIYAGGIAWKSDKWAEQKTRLIERYRALAANPILVWQAVGMLFALVIVGLMVARSGNDAGLEVSSLELKFRSILDKVLFVRPRTKEFLIGYPALVLGIALALRGRREWAAPLVVIGSIGVISALNTFCHIHTPLTLSLVRVINGAVLGAIVGLIVLRIFGVSRIESRKNERNENTKGMD